MRLLLVLIIIVFCATRVKGQSDSLGFVVFEEPITEDEEVGLNNKWCDDERQKAITDIQSGVLAIENYIGLTFEQKNEQQDFEFEQFYTNYLIVTYKIERVLTGCTSSSSRNCYFNEMNKAINEKYGLFFLKNIKNIAKEEYRRFKLLDNEGRKKYINPAYAYQAVDAKAEYSSGREDFKENLRERIDLKKFDFSNYKLKGFHAELIIDEAGNVIECRVVSKNFPLDANAEIEKAVKEIGVWKPAILYGAKVKSKTGFSFIF